MVTRCIAMPAQTCKEYSVRSGFAASPPLVFESKNAKRGTGGTLKRVLILVGNLE